ncbi:hypothetical protein DPMN_173753 [Dreissena polymorpha]|uniref:Uncharacterized protein n=1 Tax=Dreissena polymorpha TaxID=45954 RepID=A0A9D4IFT5_DREPO|nr:hypothetical protein DPMN_173753 [Dreissena polymorpha]
MVLYLTQNVGDDTSNNIVLENQVSNAEREHVEDDQRELIAIKQDTIKGMAII